jgi:hypothetical protein
MGEYEAVFLPRFWECVARYPDLRPRVEKFVRRLLADPYQAGSSHALTVKGGQDRRGKRGAHLSRNFVLVFMVCEECMNRGYRAKGYNRCDPCPEQPLRRVIFLAFGTHKEAYGHTWGG